MKTGGAIIINNCVSSRTVTTFDYVPNFTLPLLLVFDSGMYYLALFQEAKTQILKSISLWLDAAKSLVTDDPAADLPPVSDPVDCIPISPGAQLKAAKTLIEVEEYNVCVAWPIVLP